MYYNTTHETSDKLKRLVNQASSQQRAVLAIFKHRGMLSASLCHSIYMRAADRYTPLTSIRRAITDLTKAGKLEKTSEKVEGYYGRDEYIYKFVFAK